VRGSLDFSQGAELLTSLPDRDESGRLAPVPLPPAGPPRKLYLLPNSDPCEFSGRFAQYHSWRRTSLP
jgi:hypothetical protein